MLHPMTDYFRDEVVTKRPYIQLDWCMRALANPIRTEVQLEDGRIRHWNHMRLSYDPNTDSLYIHLTEASAAYWVARGFEVARIVSIATPGAAFHPIYALAEGDASAALAAMQGAGVQAIILLGTGMPSLGAILAQPEVEGAPVISCNLALMWRALAALRAEAADAASLKRWISGADWRVRYQERLGI